MFPPWQSYPRFLDPEDGGEDSGGKDVDLNARFADWSGRIKKALAAQSTASEQRMTKLESMLGSVLEKVAVAPAAPSPQDGPVEEKDSADNKDKKAASVHETDSDVRFKKLEAQLAKLTAKNEELEDLNKQKESAMEQDKLYRRIDAAANEHGANPAILDQVRAVFNSKFPMLKDDEKGWLAEIDGEFGTEFKTPEELMPDFLSSNRHFIAASKEPSGAENPATGFRKGAFSKDDFAKMTPEDYVKNQQAIHEQFK